MALFSQKQKVEPANPSDYPASLKEDQAFIDGLLETHPTMRRYVAVQNIHEDRYYAGIEPGNYGLVHRHDYASAAGWLKPVNIVEPEKAKDEGKNDGKAATASKARAKKGGTAKRLSEQSKGGKK